MLRRFAISNWLVTSFLKFRCRTSRFRKLSLTLRKSEVSPSGTWKGRSMETSYCERWVYRTQSVIESCPLSVAEQRHREGIPYTAILSEANVPRFIVEVAHNSVVVSFLDEHQGPYLQYAFQAVTAGRLFRTRAIYREYEGSTNKLVEAQTFLFTLEGKQVITVQDRVHHTSKQQEADDVDMKSNWEDYPAFGQYASVCRAERG